MSRRRRPTKAERAAAFRFKPTYHDIEAETLTSLQQLSKHPDPRIRAKAFKMHLRLKLPMSEILERVPGESISAKVRMLGINRATWYVWRSGATRPNIKIAKRLERITGYSVAEIRGVESAP